MKHLRERLLRKGDYIYGSFLKPERVDGWINAVNPGDRTDLLGRFPFASSAVDDAVGHAALGAARWRAIPYDERASAVRTFRRHLNDHAEPIAALLTRENGKPLWEARQEVGAAIRAVDLYLEEAPAVLAPRVLPEIGARSEPLPRGVVGMLSPYNMPLLMGASMSAAALLAGNTVVLKPSKFSPGTGQAIADLWDRCRLPRGTFNMVQGSGSVVGHALVSHPGLDALVFTGSYESALEVRKATAERPELPAVYQCGGKAIAIVLPSAELDRAVYEVLVGAFISAGQRHNATARVIVPDSLYERFTRELVARTRRVSVGPGTDATTFMGPVISENFRTRHRRYCRAVAGKGHTVLLEGMNVEPGGHRGNYVTPAIFGIDATTDAPFLNDEPPGPVVLCYRVRDLDAAIALHEAARFRSVTSVFAAKDDPALARLVVELHTGALHLNRATISTSLRLPTLGLGRASNGVPAGIDLLRVLTASRALLADNRPFDPRRLAPGVNWGGAADDTAPGEAPDLAAE